ncbi:MAG TPA: hypothetical protein VMV10_31570 [Pirellulales bacterium]|nr:hypothetical protein [Pirellulales bacterium]
MASIEQDLESFTQFAKQKIAAGECAASMDELFEQWREKRIAAADAAAVLESLQDLERGDRGIDFAAFVEEFSKRNGLKLRP